MYTRVNFTERQFLKSVLKACCEIGLVSSDNFMLKGKKERDSLNVSLLVSLEEILAYLLQADHSN